MPAPDEKLLALSDLNLAESHREQARWLPPTRIQENEEALYTASGTRFPAGPFNCAVGIGASACDVRVLLDGALKHFASLERGFSVYARSHLDRQLAAACEQAGYRRIGEPPGMVLLERNAPPDLPAGIELRTVSDEAGGRAFAGVQAAAFESLKLPAAVTAKIFSQPTRWLVPHWHVELLLEQERPVAGAMLLFSHGIAGVYWVGTLPDARGRGHAERIMRSLCNRAFDRGARAVVLQASPFGEPIYRRLGYQEITRYPWFLVSKEQARGS